MLFPSYRFEHPITGRIVRLGALSYIAAAFTGPLFVAIVGRRVRGVLISILVSGIHVGLFLGMIGFAAMFLDSAKAIILLAFATPAIIALHGRSTIFVLREDFRRRGWIVGID